MTRSVLTAATFGGEREGRSLLASLPTAQRVWA